MTKPWTGRRGLEILLLLLVPGAILWVVSLRRSQTVLPATPEVRLTDDFGAVTRVDFVQNGDTVAVTRRGEEYWIERPIRDRADLFFMEEVLRQARGLRVDRAFPDTAGEAYGLLPPGAGIFLRSADGRSWGIWIGDETPVGGQRYARRAEPGSAIVLVEAFSATKYFLPALRSLRDPVAASLRAGPPDSIAVLVPGRSLRARRLEADRWTARQPAGLDVDAARISTVVQLLRGPNLIDFPEGAADAEAMGLAAPRAVWVLYQGARCESVRVGRTTPDLQGVYVRPAGRSLPAVLSAEQYRSLVDGWPALADRRLLTLSPDSVVSIEFLGGRGSYRREAERWMRQPGDREVVRREALQTDLANLARLQWRSWPLSEAPPPARARRLRLRIATATAAETLQLASTGDSLAWARSTRRPLWGRIPETSWSIWKYRAERTE